MAQLFAFTNFFNTTLSNSVTTSATSITVASVANLPSSIPANSYLPIILNDAATRSVFEIVYATSISGSTLTVIRGQEGTTAGAWSVGDYCYSDDTAGTLEVFANLNGNQANTFDVADAAHGSQQAVPAAQLEQMLSIPPAASYSAQGTTITPDFSQNLTLSFTPLAAGTVMAWGYLNPDGVAAAAIQCTLEINSSILSQDNTTISQSHVGMLSVTAQEAVSVTLFVGAGSANPAIQATFSVMAAFLPSEV